MKISKDNIVFIIIIIALSIFTVSTMFNDKKNDNGIPVVDIHAKENSILLENIKLRDKKIEDLNSKNAKLDSLLSITNKGIQQLKIKHDEKVIFIRNLSTDSTILLLSRNLSEEDIK